MELETPLTRSQRYARTLLFLAACYAFVSATIPSPPPIPGRPDDKVMHMLVFGILGSLAAHGYPRRSIIALFAWLTAFGGLIEVVQAIPLLHRDSEFLDLVADMIGALGALCIVRFAVKRLSSRQQ